MPVTFGAVLDDDDRRNDTYWRHRSFVQFYLKSVVKYQRAVRDYPVVTMLAEFAGYSGIIFGISLIDLSNFMTNFHVGNFKFKTISNGTRHNR